MWNSEGGRHNVIKGISFIGFSLSPLYALILEPRTFSSVFPVLNIQHPAVNDQYQQLFQLNKHNKLKVPATTPKEQHP